MSYVEDLKEELRNLEENWSHAYYGCPCIIECVRNYIDEEQ